MSLEPEISAIDKTNELTPAELRRLISRLSLKLEDSLLEVDSVPTDVVSILDRIFSIREVVSSPAIANMFLWLLADWEKFNTVQRKSVFCMVADHIDWFSDDVSAFAASDFIARAFPERATVDLAIKLTSSNEEPGNSIGRMILEIFGQLDGASPTLRAEVQALLKS